MGNEVHADVSWLGLGLGLGLGLEFRVQSLFERARVRVRRELTHQLVLPVHRDIIREIICIWVRRVHTQAQATKGHLTSRIIELHGAPDDSVPIGRRHVDRRAAPGRGDVNEQEQPGCGHVDVGGRLLHSCPHGRGGMRRGER
eukprot:scaffold132715_cov60-Phaeocystis_antarctica.AAC.2